MTLGKEANQETTASTKAAQALVTYLEKLLDGKPGRDAIEVDEENGKMVAFVQLDTIPDAQPKQTSTTHAQKALDVITSESHGRLNRIKNAMSEIAVQRYGDKPEEYRTQEGRIVAKLTFDPADCDLQKLNRISYLTLDENDNQRELRRNIRGMITRELPLPPLDYRSKMGECRAADKKEAESRKEHYETKLAEALQNPNAFEVAIEEKKDGFWVAVSCKALPVFKRDLPNIPKNPVPRAATPITRW